VPADDSNLDVDHFLTFNGLCCLTFKFISKEREYLFVVMAVGQKGTMPTNASDQIKITNSSAIAETPRCRVGYSYGQKWKTDVLYSTTVTYLASKAIEFAKQGLLRRSRSSRSVPIESRYATFY